MTAMANPTAAFRAALPISNPQTPFSSTPGPNSVLLFDWWLVKVESKGGGKRLAISGLTTRGQHATRIFCSTPIVRRYNAYTLESEDGITVRIQGIINKARMHHNGFPPEVCNCFLTGFPYNWDGYADESFAQKPYMENTSRSKSSSSEREKHSADNSGSAFPLYIEEFPLGRVLDVLNVGCDSHFNGLVTSNSSDIQKDSTGHELKPPITKMTSDMMSSDPIVLPVHTSIASPSKCGIRKCSKTHADGKVTGPSVEDAIRHNASVVGEEVEDHVNTYSSNGACGKVNDNAMLAKLNVDALHMPSFSEKSRGDALSEGSGIQKEGPLENKDFSRLCNHKNSPASRGSGTQRVGSPTKLGVHLETSLYANVAKSPEKPDVSNDRKKGGGQTQQKRVSLHSEKTSSAVVSDDNMCKNYADGKSKISNTVVSSGRSNQSPSSEIEEGCLRILEKINSCSLSPEKVCTEHGGAVADMKSTEASEAERCLDRSLNKDKALNENSSRHINFDAASVICKLNFSNCKEPRDISSKWKTEYAKEKLTNSERRISRSVTKKLSNEGQDNEMEKHIVKEDVRQNIVRPEYAKEKLTNSECRISRSVTKKLSNEGQDNEMEKHIVKEDVRQNMVRPTPVQQEFAVATDLKLTRSHKNAQKMAKSSEEEADSRKTDTKQDIKGDCGSFHPCHSSAYEIFHADGHANDQVGMGITDKGKPLKSFGGCVTNHASPSENAVERHHAKENTVAKISEEEADSRKTDTKQDIKGDCGSFHPCPSSAYEIFHADGHANDQVGMGITDKGKPLKSFGGCVTNHASPSENAVERHHAKENTVAKIRRSCKRKADHQYASKSEASLEMQSAKDKASYTAKREVHWSFPQAQSTPTHTKVERPSFISPDAFNLRRSRSGRLLVPALPSWCQHLVYDMDGTITGIASVGVSNSTHPGTKAESLKKKKKLN